MRDSTDEMDARAFRNVFEERRPSLHDRVYQVLSLITAPIRFVIFLLRWPFSKIFGLARKFVVWMALDILGPRLWRTKIREFRKRSEKYFPEYEGAYLWDQLMCRWPTDSLCPFNEVIDELCRRRIMWPRLNRFFEWCDIRKGVHNRPCLSAMYCDGSLVDVVWADTPEWFAWQRMECSIGYYEDLVLIRAYAEYKQVCDLMVELGYEIPLFGEEYYKVIRTCKDSMNPLIEPPSTDEEMMSDIELHLLYEGERESYARLLAYGPSASNYFTTQRLKRFLRKGRIGAFLKKKWHGHNLRRGSVLWRICREVLF